MNVAKNAEALVEEKHLIRHVGRNIEALVEGKHLVLRIDLTQNNGRSKSEKNTVIATSLGAALVPVGKEIIKFGLNVYKK